MGLWSNAAGAGDGGQAKQQRGVPDRAEGEEPEPALAVTGSSALALVITTPPARTANRRARAVSDSSIVAAIHPMVSTE